MWIEYGKSHIWIEANRRRRIGPGFLGTTHDTGPLGIGLDRMADIQQLTRDIFLGLSVILMEEIDHTGIAYSVQLESDAVLGCVVLLMEVTDTTWHMFQ